MTDTKKSGFSDATFYKWRAKFGSMDVPDARKLREQESEHAKFKKLLAEAHLAPGYACIEERSRGKALAPQVKREAAAAGDRSSRRAVSAMEPNSTTMTKLCRNGVSSLGKKFNYCLKTGNGDC